MVPADAEAPSRSRAPRPAEAVPRSLASPDAEASSEAAVPTDLAAEATLPEERSCPVVCTEAPTTRLQPQGSMRVSHADLTNSRSCRSEVPERRYLWSDSSQHAGGRSRSRGRG